MSSSPEAFACLLNLLKCLTQAPHGKQHSGCPVHTDHRLLSCGDDGKVVAPGGGWTSAQQQQQQSSWGPIKEILCLIRNFAQFPNNQAELRGQGVVSTMVILADYVKTVICQTVICKTDSGRSLSDGKEVMSSAEACLEILYFASKDPANWAKEMAKSELITTLAEYMKYVSIILFFTAILYFSAHHNDCF